MNKFTIGADPELFLEMKSTFMSADSPPLLVSSVGIIEGTKDEPLFLKDGVFVMKDNVAIEFGMPPAYSEDDWLTKLNDAYSQLEQHLPKHLQLVCTASAKFPETELQTPESCQFGCDPDFNAWTKKVNVPPKATQTNFRSCGGHIHVGYIEGTKSEFLLKPMGKVNTIRMMDANHGSASIVLDNTLESLERRKLYGKAGCYRSTSYGVEYRTLSNFWLKSPAMKKLMYRLTDDVITTMNNDYRESAKFVGTNGKLIQHIINKGDIDGAKKWIRDCVSPMWSHKTVRAYEEALELVKEDI
jgi:hypothetical protein